MISHSERIMFCDEPLTEGHKWQPATFRGLYVVIIHFLRDIHTMISEFPWIWWSATFSREYQVISHFLRIMYGDQPLLIVICGDYTFYDGYIYSNQ